MLAAIYCAVVLCLAVLGWAMMPEPAVVRLSGATGLASPTLAKRRSPVIWLLGLLGRFITPRTRQGTKDDPIYANSLLTLGEFQGLKVLAAVVAGGVALTLLISEGYGPNPLVVLAGAIGWAVPMMWLRARIAKRKRAIVRLLPDVFDLLTVCIGAGLDFLGALNKIVTIQELRREPLIEELSVVLQEIKLGKRRADALKDMARRLEMTELSSFVRTLVQADRMGTPIAQVLAVHSEDVRMQRFVRAERAALKAPMKILIPLIFCIMPCVAILVGAPVFLQFMRQGVFTR